MTLYEKAEKFYSNAFEKYGVFLARYPWTVLIISLTATAVLGVGLVFQEYERNMEYLYTPENSQADIDRDRVKALFEDRSATDFYVHQMATLGVYGEIYLLAPAKGDNVLTSPILTDLLALDSIIIDVTETVDGQLYTYSDLCARRNGECVVEGILNLINDTDIDSFLANPLPYPTAIGLNGEPVNIDRILGGIVTSPDGSYIESAEILRVRYHLIEGDNMRREALLWERALLDKMSTVETNNSEFFYSVSESLNYELDEGTDADIVYFVITFVLMITYANFVCSTWNCVTTRLILSSMGVLAAAFAILGSFGFCGYIGVTNLNIVGVMPYLIIAIGVDDMFLLMAGWHESKPDATPERRIATAFGIAGVSITITSLTDLLAFSIGSANVFPSVRNFCIYTACAVFWCYIMQCTFFGSNLVFHTRRVRANRHCMTCQEVPPDEEMEGKSSLYICCCRGKKVDATSINDESVFERLPRKYLPKIVLYTPIKICIILAFCAYLGVAIWGCTLLEEGLILSNLVPPSSYLYPYLHLQVEYFNDDGPIVYSVIDEPVAYWTPEIQTQINDLLISFTEDDFFKDDFRLSWIDSFALSRNGSLPTNEIDFIDALQNEFLPTYPMFLGDLSITGSDIIASRVYVQAEGQESTYLEGQMMLKSRELAADSPLPAFAYTGAFIYYEQYVQVLPSTLLTLSMAVLATFLVCLIFMANLLCVIYMTIAVVMILVGILGYMPFWDLSLSSITMTHLIMSVGFSVDFSAHICHAFLKAEGKDRNSRVAVALSRAGVPVLNAGISSFIGVIVLVFAESYVFISFFRIMFLVVVFSVCHALFLMPVVLSFIGPSKPESKPTSEINFENGKVCPEKVEPGDGETDPKVSHVSIQTNSECLDEKDVPFKPLGNESSYTKEEHQQQYSFNDVETHDHVNRGFDMPN
ncbi:patched domain-containing protein 3-like [Glandiceps talaboti]